MIPAVLTHVRQLVAQECRLHGEAEGEELRETLLIRGGHYCGRRFDAGSFTAVWFIEENELKIYPSDGAAPHALQLGAVEAVRAAA